MLNKIGHLLGLLFVIVLLFSTRSFLGKQPLLSCISFLFFACLYVMTTVQSGENLFLYPVMLFGTLSYYLFIHMLGVPTEHFPAYSLFFVSSLLLAARLLEKREQHYFTVPLYRGMLYTVIIFSCWILFDIKAYYADLPLIPAITFIGYAVFYWVRNGFSGKVLHRYSALIYILFGYLALIYSIPLILPETYGFFLVVLAGLLLYSATWFHRNRGFKESQTFYYVTTGVLVFALIFYSRAGHILPLTMFGVGLICWMGRFLVKDLAVRQSSLAERTLPKVFLIVINLVGLAVLLQLIVQKFPVSLLNIVITLLFTFLYFRMAIETQSGWIQNRNHHIYLSGIYFCAFFFKLLFFIRPFENSQICLLFSLIPLAGILLFAGFLKKKGQVSLSNPINEISYLLTGMAFILSLNAASYSVGYAFILAGLILVCYLVFIFLDKTQDHYYAIVLFVGFSYYNLLTWIGIGRNEAGWLFLPPALICMGLTWLFSKKNNVLKPPLHFAWYLFSGAALVLTLPTPNSNILLFTICAVSLMLMGQVMVTQEDKRGLET